MPHETCDMIMLWHFGQIDWSWLFYVFEYEIKTMHIVWWIFVLKALYTWLCEMQMLTLRDIFTCVTCEYMGQQMSQFNHSNFIVILLELAKNYH